MNEKNGIGEPKPKQCLRQGESAPELPVGRAYTVEPLAVGKVLNENYGVDAEATPWSKKGRHKWQFSGSVRRICWLAFNPLHCHQISSYAIITIERVASSLCHSIGD